jgi:Fur family zinc uptake transcriptional regulator
MTAIRAFSASLPDCGRTPILVGLIHCNTDRVQSARAEAGGENAAISAADTGEVGMRGHAQQEHGQGDGQSDGQGDRHGHAHDPHGHDGPGCCGGHGTAGDVIERAERLCQARGLQFTRLRRDVLAAVAAEHKPLGAYDIAERMSAPGRRVAAVSVYRALDFLTEQGFVHRISSRNAFVSCGHEHGAGAGLVFLICRTCGGIDEMTAPAVESALDQTLAGAGFTPTSRILEVEGECGACRERGDPPDTAPRA